MTKLGEYWLCGEPPADRARSVATLGPPNSGWLLLSVVCDVLVKASVLLMEVLSSAELAMVAKGYTADNLSTVISSWGIVVRGLSPKSR